MGRGVVPARTHLFSPYLADPARGDAMKWLFYLLFWAPVWGYGMGSFVAQAVAAPVEHITLAEAVKRYGIDNWQCRVEHSADATVITLEKRL